MERNQGRNHNQLREVIIEPNVNIHAEGSVLISFGNTKVICNATIENNVPRWMKNSDEGWVTGEYGMLPRSTNERMSREATSVDCDVIQADGGTRTASITGGCVALFLAIKNHHDDQRAINSLVAAVSLGIKDNKILLDLDYDEDSTADTDLNIVMNEKDELIEIQGTAEDSPFSKSELSDMLHLGSSAIAEIVKKQKACIE